MPSQAIVLQPWNRSCRVPYERLRDVLLGISDLLSQQGRSNFSGPVSDPRCETRSSHRYSQIRWTHCRARCRDSNDDRWHPIALLISRVGCSSDRRPHPTNEDADYHRIESVTLRRRPGLPRICQSSGKLPRGGWATCHSKPSCPPGLWHTRCTHRIALFGMRPEHFRHQ